MNDTWNGDGDPFTPADEALLADLGRIVAEVDPPPEMVFELGRAAFAMRTLDSELADLVRDSESEALAVRGSGTPRLLTFESEGLSLELQVDEHGSAYDVMGQISVTGPADVSVRIEGTKGETPVDIDDLGMFRATDVPAGLVRLHVIVAGDRRVTTSWITL